MSVSVARGHDEKAGHCGVDFSLLGKSLIDWLASSPRNLSHAKSDQ
jgi:hypothetical protein